MQKNPFIGTASDLADEIVAKELLGDALPVTHAIVAAVLKQEFGWQPETRDIQFVLVDLDVDYEDAPLNDPMLTSHNRDSATLLWKWDETGDEGYGIVERVRYPSGDGLLASIAGSHLASAPSVYIVPLPRED